MPRVSQKNPSRPESPRGRGGSARNDKSRRNRRITIVIAAGILVVAIAGVAIYLDRIAPFGMAVVTVNDREVSMRSFLRRANLSGQEPTAMLQVLVNELIIKEEAPEPPYRVTVTDEEVDAYLRASAASPDETIDDESYDEWLRQRINESRMPEAEFREHVRTILLVRRFRDHLAANIPTVGEQVSLNMLTVEGIDAAREAKARLDAGAAFGDLAAEIALEPELRASRGALGWHSRGGLETSIARLVFDRLSVGEVSDPFFLEGEVFALFMVNDRDEARRLDEQALRLARSRALEDWLQQAHSRHDVQFHGIEGGGYSDETDAWVRWQLDKMTSGVDD